MAKQKTFLLVGLPHAGVPLLTAALEQHRDALVEPRGPGARAVRGRGVPRRRGAAPRAPRLGAAPQGRRGHLERGLPPRAQAPASTVVVGHELLAGAARDEIALLVDGLAGTQVHVVVLAAVPDGRVGLFPDELDLVSVLDRWETAVGVPDRLHVVVDRPRRPGRRLAGARLAGRVRRRPAPAAGPGHRGRARGRRQPAADRRELRRATSTTTSSWSWPSEWARVWPTAATTCIGDLRDLVPVRPASSTDPARAAYDDRIDILTGALAEAVAEVGRLREQLSLLRADRPSCSARSAGGWPRSAEPRVSAAARRLRRRCVT